MRKRTMIFGVPVLLLAFGFMFASCDSSVDVRDRAASWGVSGAGRGLADPGIYITVTGVPVDFRYEGSSELGPILAWRVIGTETDWDRANENDRLNQRRDNPIFASSPIYNNAGTATGYRGQEVVFEPYPDLYIANAEIADSGSFRLRSDTALTGDYIIRFTLSGSHVQHETDIDNRVFQARVSLDASNSISFGSFSIAVDGNGTRTPETGTGDSRPTWQSPETPPSHPGVTLPPHGGLDRYCGCDDDYCSDYERCGLACTCEAPACECTVGDDDTNGYSSSFM